MVMSKKAISKKVSSKKTALYNSGPTRRETLAWLARAGVSGAAVALAGCSSDSATDGTVRQGIIAADSKKRALQGYGRDPDLLNPAVPWNLILSAEQKAVVTRLADIILPADDRSPAASRVGVPDFIDEWLSAPYPEQIEDSEIIFNGLVWLEQAIGRPVLEATELEITAVLDLVCDSNTAIDAGAAAFFDRLRRVCMIAYYSSPEGMEDIGYTNSPAGSYRGPPKDILRKMGLHA